MKGGQIMNQQKIGMFLKTLRNEKSITQEQLAEYLNTSNRSISRWENGATMPDFDMLIEIAKFYNVEIDEILEGERKTENMDKITEETMMKIADYNNHEKNTFSKRICVLFIIGVIAFIIYGIIVFFDLNTTNLSDFISGLMLGIVFGDLLVGVLYTGGHMAKIKTFKKKIFSRKN